MTSRMIRIKSWRNLSSLAGSFAKKHEHDYTKLITALPKKSLIVVMDLLRATISKKCL